MNGSLYFADLVAIADSLKRGDYWAAAARAVATLNGFLNGPSVGFGPSTFAVGAGQSATAPASGATGMSRFMATGQPTAEDWDAVLGELESCCSGVAAGNDEKLVAAPNPDPTRIDSPVVGIDFGTVMGIIDLVVQIFGKFRKRAAEAGTESSGEGQGTGQPVPVKGVAGGGNTSEQTTQNRGANARSTGGDVKATKVENPNARHSDTK